MSKSIRKSFEDHNKNINNLDVENKITNTINFYNYIISDE